MSEKEQENSKPKCDKEQQSPKSDKKMALVKYGKIATMGWFENKTGDIAKTKTKVVIKTTRGLEIGEVVGPFCYKHGNFKCSKRQVEDYYPDRTRDYPLSNGGVMVRYATEEDLMEAEHLAILAKDELKSCQDMADRMKLAMKIVDAEHLLGGERIVFYFLSESRIDFRDLVKTLARELHTRIELRQIGSRDEARIIGDYESCGLECCCRSFLKILAPVNMRMAKVQKATLDPSKISGHCGRLKCCLRYEDETYKVLKKRLPPKNTLVETPNGKGRIVNTQILTQMVSVKYEDNKIEAMPLDEIKILREDRSQNQNQKKQQPVGEGNKNKKQDSRQSRRQRNQRPKNQPDSKPENKGDQSDSKPVSNDNQPESKPADKGEQPSPKPVSENDRPETKPEVKDAQPKPQIDQEPTKKEE